MKRKVIATTMKMMVLVKIRRLLYTIMTRRANVPKRKVTVTTMKMMALVITNQVLTRVTLKRKQKKIDAAEENAGARRHSYNCENYSHVGRRTYSCGGT